MREAKAVYNVIPADGKISEKDIKESTGLNVGQIKKAKKWLKENGLVQSYRGRGGYVSRTDKIYPEAPKLSKEENLAIAREVKKERQSHRTKAANIRKTIRDYVRSEDQSYSDVDDKDFDFNIVGEEEYLVVVYKNGVGTKYLIHLDDINRKGD